MPFFVSGADGSAISAMVRAASQQRGADPELLMSAAKAKGAKKFRDLDNISNISKFIANDFETPLTTEEMGDKVKRLEYARKLTPEHQTLKQMQFENAFYAANMERENRRKKDAERVAAGASGMLIEDSVFKKYGVTDVINNPDISIFEKINTTSDALATGFFPDDREEVLAMYKELVEQVEVTDSNKKEAGLNLAKLVFSGDSSAYMPFATQFINSNGRAGNVFAHHEIVPGGKTEEDGAVLVLNYHHKDRPEEPLKEQIPITKEQLGFLKEDSDKIKGSVNNNWVAALGGSADKTSSFNMLQFGRKFQELPDTFAAMYAGADSTAPKYNAIANYVKKITDQYIGKNWVGMKNYDNPEAQKVPEDNDKYTWQDQKDAPLNQTVVEFFDKWNRAYKASRKQWLKNNRELEGGGIPDGVDKDLSRMSFEWAMSPDGNLIGGGTLLEGVIGLGSTQQKPAWQVPMPTTQETQENIDMEEIDAYIRENQ